MDCVDALSGSEFFRLSSQAKTEDISLYLAELCLDCVELGFSKLCIILDNNPTHKQKMRSSVRGSFAADGVNAGHHRRVPLCAVLLSQTEFSRVCDSSVALEVLASSPHRHNSDPD